MQVYRYRLILTEVYIECIQLATCAVFIEFNNLEYISLKSIYKTKNDLKFNMMSTSTFFW